MDLYVSLNAWYFYDLLSSWSLHDSSAIAESLEVRSMTHSVRGFVCVSELAISGGLIEFVRVTRLICHRRVVRSSAELMTLNCVCTHVHIHEYTIH